MVGRRLETACRWGGGIAAGLVFSAALVAAGGERRAAAGEGPARPAESGKEAYVVFIRERTRDEAALKRYSPQAAASLEGRPAAVLAAYGRQEVLEGPAAEGVVIVRFPSFREAKAWYDGPAYRAAREHRFQGADYRAILVEGR